MSPAKHLSDLHKMQRNNTWCRAVLTLLHMSGELGSAKETIVFNHWDNWNPKCASILQGKSCMWVWCWEVNESNSQCRSFSGKLLTKLCLVSVNRKDHSLLNHYCRLLQSLHWTGGAVSLLKVRENRQGECKCKVMWNITDCCIAAPFVLCCDAELGAPLK